MLFNLTINVTGLTQVSLLVQSVFQWWKKTPIKRNKTNKQTKHPNKVKKGAKNVQFTCCYKFGHVKGKLGQRMQWVSWKLWIIDFLMWKQLRRHWPKDWNSPVDIQLAIYSSRDYLYRKSLQHLNKRFRHHAFWDTMCNFRSWSNINAKFILNCRSIDRIKIYHMCPKWLTFSMDFGNPANNNVYGLGISSC